MKKILNSTVRKWLYGIAIAFVPVAIHFGWIEPEASPVIIPLIMALFFVNPDEEGPVNIPDA